MPKLLELPFPEIRRRARTIQQLRDLSDDLGARRVGEARQLLQMLRQQMSRGRPLERRADEDGALYGRGKGECFSSDGKLPGSKGSRTVQGDPFGPFALSPTPA